VQFVILRMKKKNNIPLIDPQTFEKNYFNHALIESEGFSGRAITVKEANCVFLISRMEMGMKYINFPKESMKMTYYELMFVTDGYCSVTDNLNEFTHNKLQIRFSAPGKINSVKELSPDLKGFYCLFDKAFVDTYGGVSNLLNTFRFFDLDALSLINLSQGQFDFFSIIFDKINQDFSQNFDASKSTICAYLIAILKECSSLYEETLLENKALTSADRIAQDFMRLMNKYYLSKRTLTEYADLLNITTKHLTKSVKNATGETPMNFIHKMLILEAKILLKDTTLSVAEIAYQLSFEDAAYFNRFFKQQTGITPSTFRNKK
jgi:AraC family transcriptional regulator, transcriptional activator of pobA